MFIETNKQYFIDELYRLDIVTQPCGISFSDNQLASHTLQTRGGRVVGKIITDMHGIIPTKYFKII